MSRMAKLGKRDGLKHHCPKGLAGSNPAPGTLRGRADRRDRGPSGPAAERPGAGSTAATARRRTPEGEPIGETVARAARTRSGQEREVQRPPPGGGGRRARPEGEYDVTYPRTRHRRIPRLTGEV